MEKERFFNILTYSLSSVLVLLLFQNCGGFQGTKGFSFSQNQNLSSEQSLIDQPSYLGSDQILTIQQDNDTTEQQSGAELETNLTTQEVESIEALQVTPHRYNFVANDLLTCEQSVKNKLGLKLMCSKGGGCGVECGLPNKKCPSANTESYGVCVEMVGQHLLRATPPSEERLSLNITTTTTRTPTTVVNVIDTTEEPLIPVETACSQTTVGNLCLETKNVNRFLNPSIGDHFYSFARSSCAGINNCDNELLEGYQYEGVEFKLPVNIKIEHQRFFVKFHRLWNPSVGDHLYTYNVLEKDSVIRDSDYRLEEGGLWVATQPLQGFTPLHRWFNPINGDHFYSVNAGPECEGLNRMARECGAMNGRTGETVNEGGWQYEAIAGYVIPN